MLMYIRLSNGILGRLMMTRPSNTLTSWCIEQCHYNFSFCIKVKKLYLFIKLVSNSSLNVNNIKNYFNIKIMDD